jgi:hypothetical protein
VTTIFLGKKGSFLRKGMKLLTEAHRKQAMLKEGSFILRVLFVFVESACYLTHVRA